MARKNKPYSDKSAPYATMGDGPDSYLYKKGGKQKLVGSADNEPEAGEEELAEDEGYQYRTYTDYEEDNSKIWHEGKAPGGDWEVIDRSPYAPMDKFAWDLYVDFHKENGRWPNQQESRKIENLEYEVMTKMNEELNEIRALAGLPPVAEDCDETPGDDKNEDGDCSPFTHADENVDMVREDDLDEDVFDEDFLAPKKDAEDAYDTPEGDEASRQAAIDAFPDDYAERMSDIATSEPEDDEGWDDRVEPELDRGYSDFDRYDGDDSFDFMDEQGPGDGEFDHDEDAMVDVGDDDEFGEYDFESELDDMMGNTSRFESVEDQVVAMNEIRKAAGLEEKAKPDFADIDGDGDKEEPMKKAAKDKEEDVEEACKEEVEESAPHGSDDYEFINFEDDKAYFLVADEIGDRIIFGMNNEVGVPEQYVDGMVALLKDHGFEAGKGYSFAGMDEDLQNGYGEHEYADSYDDYFPLGSHQSPSNDLGPTASGYGDNAMQNKMRSKETDRVYEGMRQKYRRYRLS